MGTFWRGTALTYIVRKEKIDIALTHGSRGYLLARSILGILNITIVDDEHSAKIAFRKMVVVYPEIIPKSSSEGDKIRILKYPGIKEDVYLPNFHPDLQQRARLGIAENDLLVTVRPPATEAHYHNPEAVGLLTATLEKFSNMEGARVLLLPRNKNQEHELRAAPGRRKLLPAK